MNIQTDYLIIGSGAVGLAFADTILSETDAKVTIIDRRAEPGGHWNDAYSFVRLHQPSAFYGVNSVPLGDNSKDTNGLNKGLHSLASGPEVRDYFDDVMNQHFLPSGRVEYFPMSDYKGDGRFVSLNSGAETQVEVRKSVVDATFYGTTIPATHTPDFEIVGGIRLVPPNNLPEILQSPSDAPAQYAVLGAGKTGMDVCTYLLESGVEPDAISWITPRDAWLMNRQQMQPGNEFFFETIGAIADQMEALAQAATVEDLFDRLELSGQMMRLDQSVRPSMYHCATVSSGECEMLRQIRNVVRMGHVRAITPQALVLDKGRQPMAQDTLYVDCTASAIERRASVPVFQDKLITLQMIRTCQPTFSAAMIAHVEASYDDDLTKNQYCGVVPVPDTVDGFLNVTLASMMNQFQWSQNAELRKWIRQTRLDGFSVMIAAVRDDELDKQDVLNRIRLSMLPAISNMHTLMGQPSQVLVA